MTVRKIERTPAAYHYPLLIKSLLRTPLIYSPRQEIVYGDTFRYDYTTLNARVCRLAGVLKDMGVAQGKTVAIMDWDTHRYLEAFFAVPMTGCVLHTLNVRRSPDDLAYIINHAGDDVILVHTDFLPVLDSIQNRFDTPKKIILLDDGGMEQRPDSKLDIVGEYEDLLKGQPDTFDFPDFEEDAMAATFYTVGASGTPKGICFSHRQLVLHTYGMAAGLCAYRFPLSISAEDVYMPLTPMFHVNAWGLSYLFTLLGAKQVYPGRKSPEELLGMIAGEDVTFSHCDPSFIHTLINCPNIQDIDLSRWKVVVGGAPLTPAVCRTALDSGINLCSVYGMAETGPLLAAAVLKPHMADWPKEKQVEVLCRTGLPAPLVDMEIMDVLGNPLPHDGKSIGEVVVRAPWLTQGYTRDPERSKRLWSDGWLHTGDIGFIDTEGYLQLTNRTRDAIKTGGEWIPSHELERIIAQHEAVSEVAVTAIPDEKWGEKPMALVVLKPAFKDSVSESDLRDFCKRHVREGALHAYAIPEKIALVDTIPRSSVGKVSKRMLRQQQDVPFDLKNGP